MLIISIAACGNKSKPVLTQAPPSVPVVVQKVQVADAVYYDEYPATIVPLDQVELRPQVSGYISGVYFKDGDRVRSGQLLYAVDAQLYSANYEQAVANLNMQEANLNKAQKDANRYHELDKNDAVAKQLVDNADAALEVAQKQVEASRANIRGVQTNVRYTKVYAPFDGVIGISTVKTGAAVTAGQTLLNTVSKDNQLGVDFNVIQQEIFHFSKLMKDGTKPADSIFTMAFGQDIYPFPGKLYLLDRAVDPQSGTIKARLIFPNKDNMLKAGMTATVRVKNNGSTQSILIPYKAITEQLGEFFVYVPGDSSKVSQRKVTLGKQIGTNIIVTNGLKPEETIVVEGMQNLREGAVVKPVPADSATKKQ